MRIYFEKMYFLGRKINIFVGIRGLFSPKILCVPISKVVLWGKNLNRLRFFFGQTKFQKSSQKEWSINASIQIYTVVWDFGNYRTRSFTIFLWRNPTLFRDFFTYFNAALTLSSYHKLPSQVCIAFGGNCFNKFSRFTWCSGKSTIGIEFLTYLTFYPQNLRMIWP